MRHRRPAECRQIDALQRADQDGGIDAANFPFCTIEPNAGDVAVPDPRQARSRRIAEVRARSSPRRMDLRRHRRPGRRRGKGEGLGNQFLANIRETDAIAHVVRCFEDDNVTHVDGKIDPLADIETIETELMLADLESLEKRRCDAQAASGKDKEALTILPIMEQALEMLQNGKPARGGALSGGGKRRSRCSTF
jgi:ribosome-binding ATPase YchF (GTP1/OBG family)